MIKINTITLLKVLTIVITATFGVCQNATAASNDNPLSELWDTDANESSAAPSRFSLQNFSGYTEITPRIFLKERNHYKNDAQVLSTTEFELDLSLGNNLTGYIRPRLFFDVINNDLQRFEFFEGYITYSQKDWDVRLGQFVENWGITDTFNPVDVLNRRDQSTQLLNVTRLGETGIRSRWLFKGNNIVGEPTLSFYFIPWFQRTRFAPDKQRLGLGSETVSFEEKQSFEPDKKEAYFYALRYQSTLNTALSNADIQFVVSQGADKNPLIRPLNKNRLVPIYYGNRIIGAGLRAVSNTNTLAGVTFKLEVAHNNPYKFDNNSVAIPDSYFAYVIGFDWESYNVVKNQDQFTLTLEYASESGVTQAERAEFPRPFSDDMITRLFWQAGNFSRSTVELRSVYDLENHEHIVEATYGTSLLKWHKDLKLELSAIYVKPSSSPSSIFSQLPDNTSIAITLRFDF